ncbi:DUF393 domain-containing protein [Marinobacterium sp. AK62]|uniref:DUF393 domain-containing protein n=1 Tax=Marinobacterium alkalitolerans TaxID=1542925 RepID=A0ABS3ZAL0_9GAMM|nr:DUF393 domain-containing protein [Marinobacterium alkalitolerans]MBP0048707.1 DUF393 domain-containing protein [Marinobacterium alkalitolerans]
MSQRPILLYDGQCPLCKREIAHYKRLDIDRRVDWRDLFDPASDLETLGIDAWSAMSVIHAVAPDGRIHTGVHAFMLIWRELPCYRHLATVIETLRLTGLLDKLYHRFARWRFRSRCKQGCGLPPQP